MLDKKIFIFYLILSILITFLITGVIVYFLFFKKTAETPSPGLSDEQTVEEKLKDLTAPLGGEEIAVSEETIKSLTAPRKGEVSEDIIKSLTSPK